MSAAKTPAERTTTLTALREHLATLTDEKAKMKLSNTAMNNLANSVAREGFDAGSKWIAGANFTPAELENFAEGLQGSVKSEDSGRWIEWIGEKLPPDKAAENIGNLVSNWTRNDYQAAGKWLGTAPDGPAKNAAVRSYAETVSRYEPETAAEWAMTLPPGKDRDETLRNIYHNLPEEAPAARETFKKLHNIK